MPPDHAFTVDDLCCDALGPGPAPIRLLDSIRCVIEPGQHCALIGRSGSGKTLLLRTLIGLTRDAPLLRLSGEMRLGRHELLRMRETSFRRLISDQTGWIPQDPYRALNAQRTIGDQLHSLIAQRMTIRSDEAAGRYHAMLERAGLTRLEPLLTRRPSQCSGGELQRLLICAALSHEPAWLLADEPLTGLDDQTRASICDWLIEMLDEHRSTLIMSAHDVSAIRRLCTRVIGLSQGRLMADRRVQSLDEAPLHPDLAALLEADHWWQRASRSSLQR